MSSKYTSDIDTGYNYLHCGWNNIQLYMGIIIILSMLFHYMFNPGMLKANLSSNMNL